MTSFRPGTNDRDIYNSVVHRNEYRLPKHFRSDDIVIDVGTHIGSFAEAVIRRGCQKVYCVEADEKNVQVAQHNLQPFIDRGEVVLIHGAMWRSDPNDDLLCFDSYPQLAGFPGHEGGINTGGGGVLWQSGEQTPPKLALDEFVLAVTQNGTQRIRLLKLDCEGSEWPILFTARTLNLVEEICGEFHEFGGPYPGIGGQRSGQTPIFSFSGTCEFMVVDLVRLLNQTGFLVTYLRHQRPTGEMEGMGLFFATRSN